MARGELNNMQNNNLTVNHFVITKSGAKFSILDTLNDQSVGLFNSFEAAFEYWISQLPRPKGLWLVMRGQAASCIQLAG